MMHVHAGQQPQLIALRERRQTNTAEQEKYRHYFAVKKGASMHLHCEFSLVELGSTSLGCMKVVLWLSNALAPASTPAFPEPPCAAIAACKRFSASDTECRRSISCSLKSGGLPLAYVKNRYRHLLFALHHGKSAKGQMGKSAGVKKRERDTGRSTVTG
jgi:hypothetical protein